MEIPLCKPHITDDEIIAVKQILNSGWLVEGRKNKEFEKEFSNYIGTKYSISLNSCTSALQLALISESIKGEVILPSFTFVASANAIVNAGAKPVFVDIEYDTCNIDPEKIKTKITKKTEAIMPVHFAGQPCKMDEIMEIAEKYNLKVIEDSAECIGGLYNNKKTGTFGTGCFSFFPTKNMTTGEGGMLTTNNEEIYKKTSGLKAHGILTNTYDREKKERPWLRAASYAGYNYRLCDILASIGLIQLKKLDKMNDLRIKNANYLNKNLENIENIDIPIEMDNCKHVYQMYTIKVKNIDRTKFVLKLKEKGVMASVHFDPPVHLQPFYLNYGWKKDDLSVTEKVSQSIITLPMYPQLTEKELDFMVKAIEEVIKFC